MPPLPQAAVRAAAKLLRSQALLVLAALGLAPPASAQAPNPYYQLQCSMAGAYCDRVYAAPPRPESFDEFKARKAREQAIREQQRRQREAQEQLQREQARLAREEEGRQARIAKEQERERQRQLIAARIAAAPAPIRFLHDKAPVPQWTLAGLMLAFAIIAHIGRKTSNVLPALNFFLLSGLSLVCVPLTAGAAASVEPWFDLLKYLLPFLILVALNGLHFLRGWHYLFVSHPATSVAGPPLWQGTLFPKDRLAAALRPDPAQLFDHPPAYKSRDLMQKAQALRDKIDADAEIATAAMRRDRARAAKMQADAELREARKKLPWWQRWLWW